jgi:hypothetical protein
LLAQGCGVNTVPQAVPYPVPTSTPNVIIAPNFNAPSNSSTNVGPASSSSPAAPLSNPQVSQIPSAPVQTGDGSTKIG